MSKDKQEQRELQEDKCLTCGKPLGNSPVECRVCGELSCSEECNLTHNREMDEV
jgi:hypothetical protein